MIVQCENCNTKFKLPDDKVTDRGVRVRCVKCQTTFTVNKAGVVAGSSQAPPPGTPGLAPPSAAPRPAAPAPVRSAPAQSAEDLLGFGAPPTRSAPPTGKPASGMRPKMMPSALDASMEAAPSQAFQPTMDLGGGLELDMSHAAASAPPPAPMARPAAPPPPARSPSIPPVSGMRAAAGGSGREFEVDDSDSGSLELDLPSALAPRPSTPAPPTNSNLGFDPFAAPPPMPALGRMPASDPSLSAPTSPYRVPNPPPMPMARPVPAFAMPPAAPAIDPFAIPSAASAPVAASPADFDPFSDGLLASAPAAPSLAGDDPFASLGEVPADLPAVSATPAPAEVEKPAPAPKPESSAARIAALPRVESTPQRRVAGGTGMLGWFGRIATGAALLVLALLAVVIARQGWKVDLSPAGIAAAIRGQRNVMPVSEVEIVEVHNSIYPNAAGAQLFVVEATVRNRGQAAKSDIALRARILDKNGKILMERTATCAAPFEPQELYALTSPALLEAAVQRHAAIPNLEPGKSGRCMLVFAQSPANLILQRYEVEVERYRSVT